MKLKSALRSGVRLPLVIAMLLAGAVLVVFGVRRTLKPLALTIVGADLVNSGFFDLALVAFSLIVYLFVIVCAMRIWEESVKHRLNRQPSPEHEEIKNV